MSTMNMKRILAAGVAAVTMFSLAACGSTAADPNKGHVYFLNGKPEVVDQLQQLAQDYTDQTPACRSTSRPRPPAATSPP